MVKKHPANCPCGTGLAYEQCCGPYIEAGQLPRTAEQLMRSRFSAYARHAGEYILATWHHDTRPEKLDLYEQDPVQWVRLKILATQAGTAQDTSGTVEFVATMKVNGRAEKMQERSEFLKQDGRWYYVKPQESTN